MFILTNIVFIALKKMPYLEYLLSDVLLTAKINTHPSH